MQLLEQTEECLSTVKELYYFSANQTQKYWVRDNQAALKIQSKFKMYIARKQFLKKKEAAIKIQTLFRAFHARKQFKLKLAKDYNTKNMKYFAQQALIIQKMFRGYYVRKYIHNFYCRKKELNALLQKNENFRSQLDEFGRAQNKEAQQYQEQIAKVEFEGLAKNLHHLSSTKAVPGVYNSPFALEKPSVFQKSVEDHLKSVFKSSYKWRAPNRSQILQHSLKPTK